jgi:hypothetical protein
MFRTKADQIIDRAHSAIASAEMALDHAYTAADKAKAHDDLFAAQRFLRRACDAKKAWQSVDHDEYAVYPDVPETDDYGTLV